MSISDISRLTVVLKAAFLSTTAKFYPTSRKAYYLTMIMTRLRKASTKRKIEMNRAWLAKLSLSAGSVADSTSTDKLTRELRMTEKLGKMAPSSMAPRMPIM